MGNPSRRIPGDHASDSGRFRSSASIRADRDRASSGNGTHTRNSPSWDRRTPARKLCAGCSRERFCGAAFVDYRVDDTSIAIIGESPAWLQRRLSTGPVTMVAVSFAGGLSLLAASDSRYALHIRALLLMGAYDDLGRVSRFLATSQAQLPDGRSVPYAAHDYGAAVFVYSHLEQFFSARDLGVAHEALRDWLWEQPEKSQVLLSRLSPEGRETMKILLARQIERLRPKLLDAIDADQTQLAAISPEGKLANLHVPVFILHGSTDDIIPSSESLWLEKEIPGAYLREALITPAFSHVDPGKNSTWRDQLRLVRFLADVLRVSN